MTGDGPRSTFETDVARVRLVLMRELETISVYEALAREAQADELRAFFEHLALEEKEHVAEATFLLRRLDPAQSQNLDKSFGAAHFEGKAPEPNIEAAPEGAVGSPANTGAFDADLDLRLPSDPRHVVHAIPAPPSKTAGAFTVGPLQRRP